jgi:hypothetical protein
MIIGAVVEVGGRSNDTIQFRKDYMAIYATCNPNISQLLKDQIITLKIKTITWNQYSEEVVMTCLLTHSSVYANKTFELEALKVQECKDLVKSFTDMIEPSKASKKTADLLYPFTKDQSKTYDGKANIVDVLNGLLESKENKTIYIMKSCFLPAEEGMVYVIPKPSIINETNNRNCIHEIFEDWLKSIEIVNEMEETYDKMEKYLVNYYAASKGNYDRQIDRVKLSYCQ